MSGAVELSGVENPLNEQNLFNSLQSATSNNQAQVQAGTKQLQKWETKQGFYALLQDVYLHRSLPLEVRMLAVIQLKNGIEKYWRKSANNAIRPEERQKIRSRLLAGTIEESNSQLINLSSIVIAKIARFDFPLQWPDLVKDIVNNVRQALSAGEASRILSNTLMILYQVLEELSTIRLARSKASLQSVTPELFNVLREAYMGKVEMWQSLFSQPENVNEGESLVLMEVSVLLLKNLRVLISSGFEFPSREQDVRSFWEVMKSHMSLCLSISTLAVPEGVKVLAMRHVNQYGKIHLEMAKSHPTSFAFLPDTLQLVRDYWSFASTLRTQLAGVDLGDDLKTLFEKFVLVAVSLMRACIKLVFSPPSQSFKYRHSGDKEEPNKAREIFKSELFNDSFVIEMMETTILKYFVLLPGDVEEWVEEPEAWEMKLEGDEDAYDIFVRPCSERLFLDITIHFKSLIIQPLLGVFTNVKEPEFNDILMKEAVFSAVGLAASTMHEHFDFDTFLSTSLVTELQKNGPGSNIIRRRIAILLAQWIPVKISEASRPLVYQIYQHLLDKSNPCNDQVVRITAGKRFKDVANEWEFKAAAFEPFADAIMGSLMALIAEVELVETKLALVTTISVLIERMEERIQPFANSIVSLLPTLWAESGEQHLMKQAILVIFDRLIKALKGQGVASLSSMVLPIIRGALDPGSEMRVYLLEDALELWHTVLQHTSEPATPEILTILPQLIPEYDTGSENLVKVLEITRSYLYLSPHTMLAASFLPVLLGKWAELLDVVKPHDINIVTDVISLAIRLAPTINDSSTIPYLTTTLLDSNLIPKIILSLQNAHEAHQTSGPRAKEPLLDPISESQYLCILARVILLDPNSCTPFLTIIHTLSKDYGQSDADMLKWLLTEWFAHMDSVSAPTDRKLLCLGLTRLLETQQPWILSRLQELIVMWISVIVEVRDGDGGGGENDGRGTDSLVFNNASALDPAAQVVPEETRTLRVSYADPVHAVNVNDFVRHYMERAVEATGGENAFREAWLANVDAEVVKEFGALGVL